MFNLASLFSFSLKGTMVLSLILVLAACSDGSDGRPDINSKNQADNPVVEGPVTGGGGADCCVLTILGFEVDLTQPGLDYVPGSPFYTFLNYDESDVGYRETEYFVSGTATSYIATDEVGSDGVWSVEPADEAPYITRIVVQRPVNDDEFNGTVIVEWFNVSGGLDAAPDWQLTHTELFREGYAWVGVSAQAAGIEEGAGGAFGLPLKLVDPTRYGSLSHPGDSFAYDIFSQVGQSVRNPQGMDPLEGLNVERVIAAGQSQSAFRLVTYYNAIHPTIDLFDGFLIHSRASGSAPVSQNPQVDIPAPDPVYLREDLPEPVIVLQSETDIFQLNSIAARQSDSASIRLWEMAGTSHADAYVTVKYSNDKGDDPAIADVIAINDARPPFITCKTAVNDGPGHWIAKAAIHSLDQWTRTGEAAPSAPLLVTDPEGTMFEYDDLGNVLGGIRTPYVDAPVAILRGEGQDPSSAFCSLYGITELFDAAMLATLYPTPEDYIRAIDEATDAAVAAGFLRPADADLIKTRARTRWEYAGAEWQSDLEGG
jgi:hypothetical protein